MVLIFYKSLLIIEPIQIVVFKYQTTVKKICCAYIEPIQIVVFKSQQAKDALESANY